MLMVLFRNIVKRDVIGQMEVGLQVGRMWTLFSERWLVSSLVKNKCTGRDSVLVAFRT